MSRNDSNKRLSDLVRLRRALQEAGEDDTAFARETARQIAEESKGTPRVRPRR